MDDDTEPEPREDEGGTGAQAGTGGSQDTAPGAPAPESDDSEAGDTDQHSTADA